MAKVPARRYDSAAAVARALQQVESDLRLPVTPAGPDRGGARRRAARAGRPGAGDGGQDDATRLRSIVSVAPQEAPAVPSRAPGGFVPGADEPTRVRSITTVPHARRHRRPPPPGPRCRRSSRRRSRPTDDVDAARTRRTGAVVGDRLRARRPGRRRGARRRRAARRRRRPTTGPASGSEFSPRPAPTAIDDVVPSPHSLLGTRQPDGSVVFTWENPDPQDGRPVPVGRPAGHRRAGARARRRADGHGARPTARRTRSASRSRSCAPTAARRRRPAQGCAP